MKKTILLLVALCTISVFANQEFNNLRVYMVGTFSDGKVWAQVTCTDNNNNYFLTFRDKELGVANIDRIFQLLETARKNDTYIHISNPGANTLDELIDFDGENGLVQPSAIIMINKGKLSN